MSKATCLSKILSYLAKCPLQQMGTFCMKPTSLHFAWCFKRMRVKVWNTKENVDVFLYRKNTFWFWWGFFCGFFFFIPIRVPSLLCNSLKIKSSRREPLLSVKTRNFYHYFSKGRVMVLLFQSKGVSCAFISLRFFYIIPPLGLAAESGS